MGRNESNQTKKKSLCPPFGGWSNGGKRLTLSVTFGPLAGVFSLVASINIDNATRVVKAAPVIMIYLLVYPPKSRRSLVVVLVCRPHRKYTCLAGGSI